MFNSNSQQMDAITNELYRLQTLPYRLKVIGLCCKMFFRLRRASACSLWSVQMEFG